MSKVNKKLTQKVINQFDGAALLTLRRLTSEELEVLVDYVNQHQTKEEEEKHDKKFSQQTKEDKTPFG